MKKIRYKLISLLVRITSKPRYIPYIVWSKNIYIANIFRFYEYLFGREIGVRKEAMTWTTIEGGQYIIHRKFYTMEAFLVYCEIIIRDRISFFSSLFFNPAINYQLGVIALDVANNGTVTATSPLTFSHTCSGTDLILNCGVGLTATSPTISTPTYNSVNMVLAGSQQTNVANMSAMYFLVNPATGSNTVSVGFGGTSPDCNTVAVSYSGVAQVGQPDATGGTTGASAPNINWNTVANNSWAACVLSAVSVSAGNQTSRGGVLTLSGTHQMEYRDTNGPKTPAGNVSFTWTATTYAGAGMSFLPSLGQASFFPNSISQPLNFDASIEV